MDCSFQPSATPLTLNAVQGGFERYLTKELDVEYVRCYAGRKLEDVIVYSYFEFTAARLEQYPDLLPQVFDPLPTEVRFYGGTSESPARMEFIASYDGGITIENCRSYEVRSLDDLNHHLSRIFAVDDLDPEYEKMIDEVLECVHRVKRVKLSD